MTFTTKLGTAKGTPRSRIWIEGARLIDAGFTAKETRFRKEWTSNQLCLIADPDGEAKTSGKASKPIIDITGRKVATFFDGFTHVEVTYSPGLITIKGAE